MKKIIIGALAVIVVGFGGVLAANATATNGPDMSLSTKVTAIDTYKDVIFETTLKVDTGTILSQNEDPDNIPYILNDAKIKLDNIIDFELISAKVTTTNFNQPNKPAGEIKELDIVAQNNEINLGGLTYVYTGVSGGAAGNLKHNMQGPEVAITLKMKAKTVGSDINKWKLNDLIKIIYKDYDGNSDVGNFPNTSGIPINVGEVTYEMGTITGAEREPMEQPLGKDFELDYTIDPGKLIKVGATENPNIRTEDRNLVYIIDKNVVDKVGGNEETARESIIRSLEELSVSNPKTTASLVVYGENAEIIKVNDKTIFNISDLIAQISNIEASEKSGNIGDAVRMAQVLINETDSEDSVVLVSGGDSNYYTQVSEGNSTMLSTRVAKSGFVVEDKEKADEYANNVVNDIVANEESETRWYAINYALANEEILVNDLMKKLEGTTLNVEKPYYGDFTEINIKAIAPLVLKANFVATAINKSLEVHEEDENKEIELVFTEVDGEIVGVLQYPKVRVRINDLQGMSEEQLRALGHDVADPKVLEVKLVVNHGEGDPKEYVFNKPGNPNMGIPLVWYVKPIANIVAEVGLYNGRLKVPTGTFAKGVEEDITDVGSLTTQFLDQGTEFDLAIDNHFSFGMILKPQSDGDSIRAATRMSENAPLENVASGFKLYELNTDRTEFIPSNDSTLLAAKTYLVTIDQYLDGNSPGRIVEQSFELGIEVTLASQPDNSKEKIDFRGIKVNTVEKPDHF